MPRDRIGQPAHVRMWIGLYVSDVTNDLTSPHGVTSARSVGLSDWTID